MKGIDMLIAVLTTAALIHLIVLVWLVVVLLL